MWPFNNPPKDLRSKRLVCLIECLLNQNARDAGAAQSPAVTQALLERLVDAQVGMVQIPCPEMACLGFARQREQGQSIRQVLAAPKANDCCRRLAVNLAERMQDYLDQDYEIVAVLGGNEQSPGCAVHTLAGEHSRLTQQSGIFMQSLAVELARRGLKIPFRGMRDVDPERLAEDLDWLGERL